MGRGFQSEFSVENERSLKNMCFEFVIFAFSLSILPESCYNLIHYITHIIAWIWHASFYRAP